VKLIPLTHPRAGDWELVVLEEHVVEVDHLCEHHTLVLWSPGGAGLRELEEVGISWSAARHAPLTAGDRLLLGDSSDVIEARGRGDVELSIAEEVLATTEAHWALSHTHHGLVSILGRGTAQSTRSSALPELDGRSAATTTDWHEATGNDGILWDLSAHSALSIRSVETNITLVEAHLVLAALAADEAVWKPRAATETLHGHEGTELLVRNSHIALMSA
jgi:hypothetical protein